MDGQASKKGKKSVINQAHIPKAQNKGCKILSVSYGANNTIHHPRHAAKRAGSSCAIGYLLVTHTSVDRDQWWLTIFMSSPSSHICFARSSILCLGV